MTERAMGKEFTMKKSNSVRVDHEKNTDGVRGYHKTKSERVKVDHQKERWAKTTP